AERLPAFERAGRRPLVRPLHRSVDAGRAALVHRVELCPGLWAAIEVAAEVHAHRLLVLWVVVRPDRLMAIEDLDDVRRKLRLELQLLLVPQREVGERRAEDQRDRAARAGETVRLSEHRAPHPP